ncbi:hypothetical protein C5167_000635 [Papaver somniferum]|uniref:Uncharacterized protein n=1 Tax=Papaver somniferum TaxID=3469 RepID=A0A4Y7KU62_PAPSO|nr:uncharacterized protein LOC113310680 [Papaver somniferum]RZC76327.1 hypothetical protein C5167_000635 [Papaver somniferum]
MGEKGNSGRSQSTGLVFGAFFLCMHILLYQLVSCELSKSLILSMQVDMPDVQGEFSTVVTGALLTLVQGSETKLMSRHVFHGVHLKVLATTSQSKFQSLLHVHACHYTTAIGYCHLDGRLKCTSVLYLDFLDFCKCVHVCTPV